MRIRLLTSCRPAVGKAQVWRVRGFGQLLVIWLLVSPALRAQQTTQQTTDELRNLARNPVADAIKVPFVESINLNAGPYNRTSSSLQVQPLIPFQISEGWLLVPRIVATAVAYAPDVTQPKGGTTGLGDTVATFFITPPTLEN